MPDSLDDLRNAVMDMAAQIEALEARVERLTDAGDRLAMAALDSSHQHRLQAITAWDAAVAEGRKL